MKKLKNYNIFRKNVLLRVDLNVPVSNGKVEDYSKIHLVKRSIKELINRKNKVFLLSHFGRPKGIYNNKYTLKFITDTLSNILSISNIHFVPTCFGEKVSQKIKLMKPGEICLLENVRFNEGEEKNDTVFSKALASNFDFYINDAFSASHRKHASIVGITKFIPSIAGFSLIKEMENLNKILESPKNPTTAIIGGSKVSTKLNLLNNLVEIFDTIVIGGAMANTFLVSKGLNMGKSLVEKELVTDAFNILEKSKKFNSSIILPVDLICSLDLKDSKNVRSVDIDNLHHNEMALDIGDKTIEIIKSALLKSKLILWNGPIGAFEYKPFDYGTNEIAEFIKNDIYKKGITTIAGGGDTMASIKKTNADKYFSYVSTAGGAFLEWLEGNESPGIIALRKNNIS